MWLVPLKTVFNVSRFKPALICKRFLADLRHGSNSENSDSSYIYYISNFSSAFLGTYFFFVFSILKMYSFVTKGKLCIFGQLKGWNKIFLLKLSNNNKNNYPDFSIFFVDFKRQIFEFLILHKPFLMGSG